MRYTTTKEPRFAKWILALLSRYEQEFISCGDLGEEFKEIAETQGSINAHLWYWGQVLYTIPSYLKYQVEWSFMMIRNYLKISFRNLKKHKIYSFINIAGLTIGMTCTILIMLYIQYELSYDQYHEQKNNIYRIVMYQKGNMYHGTEWFNATPGTLKPTIDGEIPEVLNSCRAYQSSGIIIHNGNVISESDIRYVDPEFLLMFTYPLIKGDPNSALNKPFSLILTERMVIKYFGNSDPMGKTLNINNMDYTITGVMDDVPENSHFTFDFLASFNTIYVTWGGKEEVERWNSNNTWGMYILVRDGANLKNLEQKLTELRRRNIENNPDDPDESRFKLQLLTDIHLHSRLNFDEENISDIRYIYLFSAIALLITLIACLNYMNLATARSVKRAKEVGIRKVVGAFRINLIKQFLGESILYVGFALAISFFLVYLLLPFFSNFIERELELNMLFSLRMYTFIIGIVLFVGVVSGSYPALFLSSFKPINIVRGVIRSGSGKSLVFRNSLVVIQFMISVILIICSLVVYSQIEFIRNKNLGFSKEHIVYGITSGTIIKNFLPFKEEIESYTAISEVYALGALPTTIRSTSAPTWENQPEGKGPQFYYGYIDYNFVDFFGCEIVKGRNFSREFSTDVEEGWLLNETAVKLIGWEKPIGKKFGFSWLNPDGKVIGVVKDFHNNSLHLKVEPIALCLTKPDQRPYYSYYAVKLRSENIPETLNFLEQKFKAHSPDYPFSYFFLDEKVERLYHSERKLGEIFTYFTAIAIFISCLGLFGLVSFTVEQRTKEIGVRKVLGANIGSVVKLISREFLILIVIANLFSWPIAWYAMSKWLQNFAYRIDFGIWIFILSGISALTIAILTISYHTIKAAIANPVESLRYE